MPKANTARRVPIYRGEAYWEREKPETAETGRLALNYFPNAGKLQISQTFKDRETGETRRGKTVTIDCEDVQLYPAARELLEKVLEAWSE